MGSKIIKILRQDKEWIEGFRLCLAYLTDKYARREIADVLNRVSQECFRYPVNVDHASVTGWKNKGVIPQSDAIIFTVIKWAEMHIRINRFLKEANYKIDELTQGDEHSLLGSLDYLKSPNPNESYDKFANRLKDILDDSIDSRKLLNWHAGKNKPRPRKGSDYFKQTFKGDVDEETLNHIAKRIKGNVPNEVEGKITARVAGETGLDEKIFYSLYPIFDSYLRPLLKPDIDADLISEWESARPEYERRKAEGLV